MTNATKKPWHIAHECPKCGGPFGKPCEGPRDYARMLLICCACGHPWVGSNAEELAKAWFGQGANEARELLDDAVAAERQRVLAWLERLLLTGDEGVIELRERIITGSAP